MQKLDIQNLELKAEEGVILRADERRAEPRYSVAASAQVQLLSDALTPIGEPLTMVVRDISRRGLGLLSRQSIDASYLSLRLDADAAADAVFQVLRCNKVGAFYDVGSRLLNDAEVVRIMLSARKA
jgi:hypothetical protein